MSLRPWREGARPADADRFPGLETERLVLRPLRPEDLAEHHARLGADPGVTWHGRARTLEESDAVLRHRVEHWRRHGFGLWAVRDRESGEFLGEAGLQHLEATGEVEVGYYLARAAWGRGVATEAGEAALRHGFAALALERILAVVRPENEGSKRVLAKLGLRRRGFGDHYGVEGVEVWGVERAAWEARRGRSRADPARPTRA